jgi:hypothetical protein
MHSEHVQVFDKTPTGGSNYQNQTLPTPIDFI